MTQYREGTVTLTNNSATVVGGSTDFVTASNVRVGDLFKRRYENAFYQVTSVNSATNLNISPVYAQANASSVKYEITRDFTTNLDLPEIGYGDIDFQDSYTRAMRTLDSQMFKENVASPNVNATVLATQDVVLASGNITVVLPRATNKQKVYIGVRSTGNTVKVLASSPPDYIASGGSQVASITRTAQYSTVVLIGDGGTLYYKF